MKKRLTILSIALLLTLLLCTPAFAKTVCKIGSKGYSSLQKAVDAAKNGDTIKVVSAITTDSEVHVNKKVTIDFAKKKYTYNGSKIETFAFHVGDKAVVKRMNLYATQGFFVERNGSLTVQSGSFEGGKIINNGKLTISGGSFLIKDLLSAGNPQILNFGTMEMTGGTGDRVVSDNMDMFVWNIGTLNISGGTLKGSIHNAGTCTITGGKLKRVSVKRDSSQMAPAAKLVIKGGTFSNPEGTCVRVRDNGTATISKGTFTSMREESVIVSGENAVLKVKGGTFDNMCVQGEGKVTLSGGKTRGQIESRGEKAKITINKHTVKISEKMAPFTEACLMARSGGTITVKGGSFTNKYGFGYLASGGKVNFSVANWKSLFNVKALTRE